jgi:hypothetical protein
MWTVEIKFLPVQFVVRHLDSHKSKDHSVQSESHDGKIMKGTFYENRDGTDKDHFTITK